MRRSRSQPLPVALSIFAATLTAAEQSRGQRCAPEVVTFTEIFDGEYAFGAANVGHVLYIAAYTGVRLYDLSDPHEPAPLQTVVTSPATGIAVFGSIAVVPTLDKVVVMDVSDPAGPVTLGDHPLTSAEFGAAISSDGSTAWLGDDGSLVGVDIRDPTSPAMVSTLPLSSELGAIAIDGDIAYIVDGRPRSSSTVLRIVNTRDPAAPVEIATMAIPRAISVAPHGETLYLSTYGAGIRVINISDPSSPVEVTGIPEPPDVSQVVPAPPLAFALGGDWLPLGEDLLVFDISTPRAPELLSSTRVRTDFANHYIAHAMVLRHGTAYINENFYQYGWSGWRLTTVDVSSCQCPADCDASGELDFFDFLCFQNLFAAGDPAADCDGSGGLDLFDFLCFQNRFAGGCP